MKIIKNSAASWTLITDVGETLDEVDARTADYTEWPQWLKVTQSLEAGDELDEIRVGVPPRGGAAEPIREFQNNALERLCYIFYATNGNNPGDNEAVGSTVEYGPANVNPQTFTLKFDDAADGGNGRLDLFVSVVVGRVAPDRSDVLFENTYQPQVTVFSHEDGSLTVLQFYADGSMFVRDFDSTGSEFSSEGFGPSVTFDEVFDQIEQEGDNIRNYYDVESYEEVVEGELEPDSYGKVHPQHAVPI